MTLFVQHALLLICLSPVALGEPAKLVLLNDAVSKGAVCLDGSPPGYYLRPGIGSGENKVIIHMEGGGMCWDEDDCVSRSKGNLGSSKHWPQTATYDGFLSDDPQINPLFFNWTLVFLMYCDGASFSGDVTNTVNWKGTDLYFRGFRILKYAMEAIKSSGSFSEVILTGCSAGGLATYLHADFVSTIFAGVKFSALADAGFFIDAPNITGDLHIQALGQYALNMQNSSASVDKDCAKAYPGNEEWKCFFPQYLEPYIKTRIFGINSMFDTWQLANILQIGCRPPGCSEEQIKAFENYGKEFLKAFEDFTAHSGRGYFVDSCLVHCHSKNIHTWAGIEIKGQRANETFANWYYGTGSGQEMDCSNYPCNHSCS